MALLHLGMAKVDQLFEAKIMLKKSGGKLNCKSEKIKSADVSKNYFLHFSLSILTPLSSIERPFTLELRLRDKDLTRDEQMAARKKK